jgi:hypothetical protein
MSLSLDSKETFQSHSITLHEKSLVMEAVRRVGLTLPSRLCEPAGRKSMRTGKKKGNSLDTGSNIQLRLVHFLSQEII